MEKYVCIHGHFYQPPRENPWLESVELQDSAYPYHDWNERITAECYATNAASRILDGEGYITEIVNNYSRISFDFGPTLLAWLEPNAPEVYRRILEADRRSQETFSGHGSAIAQPYNHIIMPLANSRDKHTQIVWGIRDFEHRFGRSPEGMWLPETAVDLETLDIMAGEGIRFTILAPHQARRWRKIGEEGWQDANGGNINRTMPYTLKLLSGRALTIFFYDDEIARAVAFGGLLSHGEEAANRLIGTFRKDDSPQLVHVATDGETFGHHHRFGDMALAYALHYIESQGLAKLTNYGEYLEKYPPTHEVEINEYTSWSCPHGVERWRSDCGCHTGGEPGWNQAWRAPLRESMDSLRDEVAPAFGKKGGRLLKDPWAARNDYISVILDRSPENIEAFFSRNASSTITEADKITILKLMELERHAMLMFTSCGWFFSEVTGIETVQIIQHAARTVQLAQELFGDTIEARFLKGLERIKSNIPAFGNGRDIYKRFVRPAMVDLAGVAAHFAINSIFGEYSGRTLGRTRIYSYDIDLADYQSLAAGASRLAIGKVTVTSEITRESAVFNFGVLHLGSQNLVAGVRKYRSESAYQSMLSEISQVFSQTDFPQVIRLMDRHFGEANYSIKTLFKDVQRRTLSRILEDATIDVEGLYRQLYDRHYALIRFLIDSGNPLPETFHDVAEFIFNTDLRRALEAETPDREQITNLIKEAEVWRVKLDNEGLSLLFSKTVERILLNLKSDPRNQELIDKASSAVTIARSLPFTVDLWKAQNIYYKMLEDLYPELVIRVRPGEEITDGWIRSFITLGEELRIRVSKWLT